MRVVRTIQGKLAFIERLLAEAARRQADPVLFPECLVTSYGCDSATLEPLQAHDALAAVGEMAAKCRTWHRPCGQPIMAA
jgi:predicted amidohydrolase